MARSSDTSENTRADNWFSFKKLLMDESEDMRMVRQGVFVFWALGSWIGLEAGTRLIDPATLFGGRLGAPEMAWGFIFGGVGAVLGVWFGKWEVNRQYRRGTRR